MSARVPGWTWTRWMAVVLALLAGGSGALASGERNHLSAESSPYLRLHADDFVHWRTWDAGTLADAARAGRPILLSIGYSSCHWCHVMRHESFTDRDTADVINALFFPILVDREERPEIDALFQSAAVALGLPTGWPLTMFLTPDGNPFWGGTYFPKRAMAELPPFIEILRNVHAAYVADPRAVAAAGANAVRRLERATRAAPGTITSPSIDAAAQAFNALVDPFFGGFGSAPKYPYPVALELLWRAHIRTGDKTFADAVSLTLEHMAAGGVYDHVGGGFFRYAVDNRWHVPHFEKMLDVNAAMVRLLSEAWRETKAPVLGRTARRTVAFLLGDMRLASGAFAASLDADSRAADGAEREGAFYVWCDDDIRRVLGDGAALFLSAYGLAPLDDAPACDGEPAGTLYRSEETAAQLASRFGIAAAGVDERLDAALARLAAARDRRPRPRRDEKLLADWNGMAVAALAEAGAAFDEPRWLAAARQAFAATVKALSDRDGRLRHSRYGDVLGAVATLGDLAELANAAVTLFEATGDRSYLLKAVEWTEVAVARHADTSAAGFFSIADDADPLIVRIKPVLDMPNASGNARMAEVLAKLYFIAGDAAHLHRAERTLAAVGGRALKPDLNVAGLLNAAEVLNTALQVVIIGRRGDAATDDLTRLVMRTSLPNRVMDVIASGTELPEGHPARYKSQVDGKPTAYVCRGTVCSLPVTDGPGLAETLLAMRRG